MKPTPALDALDADIAELERRLGKLRELRGMFAAAYGLDDTKPQIRKVGARGGRRPRLQVVARGQGRRPPLVAGSLPGRIVEILTEFQAPLPMADLIDRAKARKPDTVAAVKQCITDRRVVKVGGGRWAKYATPQFANVIVAETE